ncbi:LexA family protein [Heyndrickxia oleronia]|uniref:LexA family protein n=1 Tax=Heyndrickxia oleronia TaxID=38875 RepID=UPI001B0D2494|nr:XRE family transcriptional regulator [Heyndrickxia oleronia]GIN38493.1 LexA family transcriptional regulator [Heyndrickxia oleronia]
MSKNLKAQLKKVGKSQTDLAKELNLPEMTVSNWVKAKTYPRIDKIQLMADYFGIKRSDLTEDKPENLYDFNSLTVKVPILGTIACGEPILVAENFEGYRYESADTLPQGETYYLKAKGDSMEPTIPNGSSVLIRMQNDVENGEIAAILLNGDTEATLKRVKKQGDVVILMPDNPVYEPIIVSEKNPARIIGKAIRYTVDL